MTTADDVYQIVRGIPKGKVMSYGQIGKILGIGPRQVGRILHNNPDNSLIPCHRVVKSDGGIASGYAFGGEGKQREFLEAEGVIFRNGRAEKSYFWGLVKKKPSQVTPRGSR